MHLTSLVEEISSASEEQDIGIKQIHDAMVELDAVTQDNAKSSEQLAHSSMVMLEEAQKLTKMMSYFKIKDSNLDRDSFDFKEESNKRVKKVENSEFSSDSDDDWENF